uniref:Kringle domain-containing protein n=1 Tax=Panthera leo TaxID=9689 RepID=A0A8C8WMV2_PANLE
ESKECYQGNGQSYRGTSSTTITGKKCQPWSSMAVITKVWEALHTPAFCFQYCRNPDGDVNGPWCYTMSPRKLFDYCDVPQCGKLLSFLEGDDFSDKCSVISPIQICKRKALS